VHHLHFRCITTTLEKMYSSSHKINTESSNTVADAIFTGYILDNLCKIFFIFLLSYTVKVLFSLLLIYKLCILVLFPNITFNRPPPHPVPIPRTVYTSHVSTFLTCNCSLQCHMKCAVLNFNIYITISSILNLRDIISAL
jgi:hypothetical protein